MQFVIVNDKGYPRVGQMLDRKFQIRRLHRAGNSAQVTIAAALCKAAGLEVGGQVYQYLVGNVVCIKRFDEGGFTPEVIPVRVTPPVEARDE